MATRLKMGKLLDLRARLVFCRLQRFYQTFNIIATLLGGLSLAVLTFNEFHPSTSPLTQAAEGLLCSSALTAVIAVTIATMLLFRFDGHEKPTRKDLAIAWLPLVLVDWVILQFLLGLIFWYADKNNKWRGIMMALQLALWLALTIGLAVWMWSTMSTKDGLGTEEHTAAKEMPHGADHRK